MAEDGHHQHRRHGTAVDWASSASSVPSRCLGRRGPTRTPKAACADGADGADEADAENPIDLWKPFSSLAAPASSAVTSAKRSPRTAFYRSHLTTCREAMPISCAGVRLLTGHHVCKVCSECAW